RMRGLVSRGFTPRRVAGMEEGIRALTVEHLDASLERGDFDFVADLAGKVPMDVISEMLGVGRADRAELRRLSDLLVHREEGVTDVPPAGVEAAFTLAGYYADLIAERRANPGDDLVSALCAAEVDGDRLTDDDMIAFLFLMVVAGNETTTKLLAHAWYWAWRNPDERAKAFADPTRIPDWVEETLRYDTSSQMLARITLTDVTLHDTTIPAGDRVLLLAGSANRD
ncbi:MAG: cytochrome P450, partial [Acidimicrobiales bacterium]|nr:cytochrome P450 [Acidimicrobiales bacterium]